VLLNGTSFASTSGSISMDAKAGRYSYYVPPEDGYVASPSNGSFELGQGGAQISVKFSKPLGGFSLVYSPYFLVAVGALMAIGIALAISILSRGGELG